MGRSSFLAAIHFDVWILGYLSVRVADNQAIGPPRLCCGLEDCTGPTAGILRYEVWIPTGPAIHVNSAIAHFGQTQIDTTLDTLGNAPAQAIVTAGCRNGFVDEFAVGGEECDDGNNENGDGCHGFCKMEYGWYCDGSEPSDCETHCGDGMVAGLEACDDGNTDTGDGCDDYCAVEYGWYCDNDVSYDPDSDCYTECGDGIPAGEEECDWGDYDPVTNPDTDSDGLDDWLEMHGENPDRPQPFRHRRRRHGRRGGVGNGPGSV